MRKSIVVLSLSLISILLFSLSCGDNTLPANPIGNSDIFEPNGYLGLAYEIDTITTGSALIDPSVDQDYFKVVATTGRNLTFTGNADLDLRLSIYTEDKAMIFSQSAGSKGGTISHTVKAEDYGPYFYFMIESAVPGCVGSYTIKLD